MNGSCCKSAPVPVVNKLNIHHDGTPLAHLVSPNSTQSAGLQWCGIPVLYRGQSLAETASLCLGKNSLN